MKSTRQHAAAAASNEARDDGNLLGASPVGVVTEAEEENMADDTLVEVNQSVHVNEARRRSSIFDGEQSAALRIEKMITESFSVEALVERNKAVSRHWLLDSMAFSVICGGLVFLNTLSMGFEAEVGPGTEYATMLLYMEYVFTSAFFVEMMIKLCVLRKAYCGDMWNLLDAFVTIMGVLDVFVFANLEGSGIDLRSLSILRVLRLVRLVRVLKLMKQFKKIVIIINGVTDAIKTTMWVGLVLFGAIYVCAIFCVDVIGRGDAQTLYPGYEDDEAEFYKFEVFSEFNPYLSFGSMGRAMLTLFNIAILAEWTEVVRPISVKQPYLLIFFIMFGLFITFGVMNVIIGLIVDNVMANARAMSTEEEEKVAKLRLEALRKIQHCFQILDHDGDRIVTLSEIRECAQEPASELAKFFKENHLQSDLTADEFFACLDEDGDGQVDENEFVASMYRLMGFETDRQFALLMMAVKQIKHQLNVKQDNTLARIRNIEKHLGVPTSSFDVETVSQRCVSFTQKAAASTAPAPKAHPVTKAEGSALTTEALSTDEVESYALTIDEVSFDEAGSTAYCAKQEKLVSTGVLLDSRMRQDIYSNPSTELERLGRALEGMRRLESGASPFTDASTVRSMEEVSRILESARREAEDAIQCKLRQTVAGCLKVVQHTLEASGMELPNTDLLRINQLAQVREGVGAGGSSSSGLLPEKADVARRGLLPEKAGAPQHPVGEAGGERPPSKGHACPTCGQTQQGVHTGTSL